MSKNGKKRTIIRYKSYSFVDKDPIIDALRTAVSDSGKSYREISNTSNVSASTVRNWFHGNVRRPQFATVAAVAQACGKHTILINKGKADIL